MFKSILLFKENFNLRILRIKNAKFSGYYLYMNKKTQGMCISAFSDQILFTDDYKI